MAELDILRFAAFADGSAGGNPAGIVLTTKMPDESLMRQVAADVGYSETAFAVPAGKRWRVRYFAPESEVPFCGHATIALGAALAIEYGDDVYQLQLNDTTISVEGRKDGDSYFAALQSPATASYPADQKTIAKALALFGYKTNELDKRIEPAITEAGARHLVLALSDRDSLSRMNYDLEAGQDFMKKAELVTVNLVYVETPQLIHSRNAFASGGVHEDPATGAAAAALAGYLRDLLWPHEGRLSIVQGEDMGLRSILTTEFSDIPGSSIRVSGAVRTI